MLCPACAHGSVYVPRYQFQSCSNCELQQSHFPTTTANHESNVRACRPCREKGCVCVCARARVCVCVSVCVFVRGGGYYHFSKVSPFSLYGHTGVLGLGRSPLEQAFSTGQGCIPVLPLDQHNLHSRPDPGSLPQDHPGSGVVAPWLLPGQLHGIRSTSPRVLVGAYVRHAHAHGVRVCVPRLAASRGGTGQGGHTLEADSSFQ